MVQETPSAAGTTTESRLAGVYMSESTHYTRYWYVVTSRMKKEPTDV